ncbi:MAG: KpsF/GutQ family sugar-phosphate isomerase [Cytophagales bacterium]|nr:MAG: KpsF/GutQ family sugar-phosphate isomerase [Cytophagales bacterium]
MKIIKNIKTIAKNVLEIEANAILYSRELIDDNFEACIKTLLECRGRVVITGIGKSAIIGQKIVATMNSTGTPALFMHAADAIHGDLGMIQNQDTVICISKSGNTSEIKILMPLLKRTGAKIIALVGDINSTLAVQSDFVINATSSREACPLNLAPTTSTTLALALGDAIAMCLLECRNFTKEDFAKYHPGGALGKKLYLKVEEIYPNNLLPKVANNAKIKDVIYEITSKRLGATAVVNQDNELCGMITDGDLRRMMEKFDDFSSLLASDIMSKTPTTIHPEEYAVLALQIMQSKNITQLIVVEEKTPIGFIHLHDLLKEGLV